MTKASITSFPVIKYTDGCNVKAINDLVAVEEPLEIILEHGPLDQRVSERLAITMRTPGNDLELVVGFLAAEKIIDNRGDIVSIRHCRGQETHHKGFEKQLQFWRYRGF